MKWGMGLMLIALLSFTTSAHARRHHHRHHHHIKMDKIDANGNLAGIIRTKMGAIAHVAARYASQFQGYIDDLELNYGATLHDIGGIRRGRGSIGHQHPLGKALDLCQLRRDKVRSDCNLPDRATLIRVAAEHGLFEGGQWCNGDMGHAQITPSGNANCHKGDEGMMMAKAHHRRHHYAHHRRHPVYQQVAERPMFY